LKNILGILVLALLMVSCYREELIIPGKDNAVFNFIMKDSTKQNILDSRNNRFEILPTPILDFEGVIFSLDNMKVRGQTTTNFQRKSLSVNMDGKFVNDQDTSYRFEVFKLLSLVYDYTYIENGLSHKLLSEVGLWPLYSFFTQVSFNNEHQGLYLFVEDPEHFLYREYNAEVVIRRYYKNGIKKIELNPDISTKDESYYRDIYLNWYQYLVNYSGEELYIKLSNELNLSNYMRKMAIDFILKNGDYVDEISFYGFDQNGKTYFDILPWDYDDIFADKPHEVGKTWGQGGILGDRYYETYDDVLEVLDGRLIFSIEEDIDYIIATDDYLYGKYLVELEYVMSELTVARINEMFDELENTLTPFYQISEIVDQSKYDANKTNWNLFQKNIKSKRTLLVERIEWINEQISNQKN
jgi:spore coat protein H